MPTISINGTTGAVTPGNAPLPTTRDGRTADERHFGTELYCPGIYWRRGRAGFQGQSPVTRELFESVAKDAGPLFSSDDEKQIATIAASIQRSDEQLCENAYLRISYCVLPAHFQTQIDAAVARGEQPPPVPSHAEILNQTQHVRRSLHARKNQLNAEAFAILKPGILKFSKAAWTTAKKRDSEERGGLLARWRMAFVPSAPLRALVYLALRSAESLKMFEESGQCAASTDPAAIWAYLIQTQPAPLPPGTTVAEVREMQRYQEEKRRQKEMDAERDEHKRKVKALNEWNDAIREERPLPVKTAPPVPAPSVIADPAPAPETANK